MPLDAYSFIKTALKKIPLVSKVNAVYKCRVTKRKLRSLERHYAHLISKKGMKYDPTSAIAEFGSRLQRLQPNYQKKDPSNLKVFWVGTSYHQDNSGFLQSLNHLAKVTVFHNVESKYGLWNNNNKAAIYDAAVISANDQALKKQIQTALTSGGIDVLMGQMWAGRISREVLAWVRSQGIPVINISMDDRLPEHWGYWDGVRLGGVGLAPEVDMVLTTSPETCPWYWAEGSPSLYMPLASDPKIYQGDYKNPRDIDVLFIGNKYGVRAEIIKTLVDENINVSVYGAGWQNGSASFEESIELSKRAKIILGIGTVGHCKDLYTLKLRDFDGPMSGALYLTHKNKELASLYEEGSEIEFYETGGELVKKLRHYLSDNEKRLTVAQQGQTKAIQFHSWSKRLSDLFEDLGLMKKT